MHLWKNLTIQGGIYKMDKKIKQIGAVAIGALLIGAGGLAFGLNQHLNPTTITEQIEIEKVVEVEKVVEKPVEVLKEVVNNVTIEVPVLDEDKAAMFCDRLLFDDVKECLEEVEAENAALKLALEYIESEFNGDIADELEDRGIIKDEDEVDLIKVYSDFEDITILKSDFDDEEYKFKIKLKIEDEDKEVKKYVYATISIEDSEIELKKLEE